MCMCAHACAAGARPRSPGQMFPVMHDGCAGGHPLPGPLPRPPFPPLPSPSRWASHVPGRVPAPRHPALLPGSFPAPRACCTLEPRGGCGEHGRGAAGSLHPTARHPKCTNSTALPPSHWVLSGPFCLCSPHPIPGLTPWCSSRLGEHPSPVSPQIPVVLVGYCLVKEILSPGWGGGGGSNEVSVQLLQAAPQPQTVLGCRMGDSTSALMH